MGVEVRKVDTDYAETGVGQSTRTDTTYELGAEIDGAWVTFARVPGNTVDALVARAKESAASGASASTGGGGEASEGQTMADVAPTPAPQQEAATSSESTV